MPTRKLKKITNNDVVYFASFMVATNLSNEEITLRLEDFINSFHTKDWSYNIQQLDIKKLDGFKPVYTKKEIPELA